MRYSRTFQEGTLSKRLLVFTNYRMSFHCAKRTWHEGLGCLDPDMLHEIGDHPDSTIMLSRQELHPSLLLRDWRDFVKILELYSGRRQITKEADTLDAFLGVMNHIRRSQPIVQTLRGLPFFRPSGLVARTPMIDTLEELLAAALSWTSLYGYEYPSPRRQSIFPSWTWAGWSGQIRFWSSYVDEAARQSFVRHAQLESPSGRILVTPALYKDNVQHELDTVTLIQFEAPTIPASSFFIVGDELICMDIFRRRLLFRVAWGPVSGSKYGDIVSLHQLLENIRKDVWSCLLLSSGRRGATPFDEGYSSFVLVICWKADRITAERIGWFIIGSDPSTEAELEPLGEQMWKWRRVRLI